jgi:hypothetical protein
MPHSIFCEWMAFWVLHPFGPEADDRRGAIMPATFANAFTEKGKKPVEMATFMLGRPEEKKKEMTGQQMFDAVATWVKALDAAGA